jgi:hypothetical protein
MSRRLEPVRPPREPEVLCAACGARFRADEAGPGARVACGLCGTPLVLGALCRDKRRYRSRSASLPRAGRLDKGEIRAFAFRAFLVIAVFGLVAAAWTWREPIAAWLREARAAVLHLGNGR